MRPLIGLILRRVRRIGLTSLLSLPRRLFTSSTPPARHIKIDDEENQSLDSALDNPHRPLTRLRKMILPTLLILLVLSVLLAYIIYKPPHILISFVQWQNPDVLWHLPLPSRSHVVALTIDDAPSDQTAKMLDSLKAYGAKATFFVIGSQIASYPELVQRMHDEGHEIGNHAWRDEPSISLPLSELELQIIEVESLIPANPNSAKYFRPGTGFFNKKMVDKVIGMGYRVVLGSIYPHDPQIHNPKMNSMHVLSMLRPGGIIIMHDRRSYSAEQLELVLRGMAAREWKAESLGGLLRIADELEGNKEGS